MKPDEKINLAISLGGLGVALAVIAIFLTLTQPKSTGTIASADVFFQEQAKELGIRSKTFEQCLTSDEALAKVEADENEVIALTNGQVGTPYSILIAADGTPVPVSGALPYEVFELVITLLGENNLEEIQTIYNEIYSAQGGAPDVRAFAELNFRSFDPNTDHYKGNADADFVIIEYSDYECPYCALVHPTMNKLVESDLNVAWVYRHLPLTSIHPQAKPAAIAAECIAEYAGPEAFWSFTDMIYEDQSVLQQ